MNVDDAFLQTLIKLFKENSKDNEMDEDVEYRLTRTTTEHTTVFAPADASVAALINLAEANDDWAVSEADIHVEDADATFDLD